MWTATESGGDASRLIEAGQVRLCRVELQAVDSGTDGLEPANECVEAFAVEGRLEPFGCQGPVCRLQTFEGEALRLIDGRGRRQRRGSLCRAQHAAGEGGESKCSQHWEAHQNDTRSDSCIERGPPT